MKNAKIELLRKDKRSSNYIVDNISNEFMLSIAAVYATTHLDLKETHSRLLNVLWNDAARDFILNRESVFSFDEIKAKINDSTDNNENILKMLSEINCIISFEEKDGISFSSWWLINGVKYNSETILLGINQGLTRAIIHKEILLKNTAVLEWMESDYIRQLFLNIEFERIKNKLRYKTTKSIVISPQTLFFGLELNPSEFSIDDIETILLALKLTKSEKYVRRCNLQYDGTIAIEFFKAIKYDMNNILFFQWTE